MCLCGRVCLCVDERDGKHGTHKISFNMLKNSDFGELANWGEEERENEEKNATAASIATTATTVLPLLAHTPCCQRWIC